MDGTTRLDRTDLDRLNLGRLPLAEAALLLFAHALDGASLGGIFDRHRGRCYERVLSFPALVGLVRDALVGHGGSGHAAMLEARGRDALPVSTVAAYGKLGRVPPALSAALLEHAAGRLATLLPAPAAGTGAVGGDEPLPASLSGFRVVVLDGKTLKHVRHLLKETRPLRGKLTGGKLAVAMELPGGLALAMEADPDGNANEVPLVPGLVRRVRDRLALDGSHDPNDGGGGRGTAVLWMADAQFCDLNLSALFAGRGGEHFGEHFLIRYSPNVSFHPDPRRPRRRAGVDARGRAVVDEWGWLGAAGDRRRRYVRRVTLNRPAADGGDVLLITDLLDADRHPAADLLALYLRRWGIEVCQPFCLPYDSFYESAFRGLGRASCGSKGRQYQPLGQVRSRRRRSSSSASAQKTHRPPAPGNLRAWVQPRRIQLYSVGCGSPSSRARSLDHHSPWPSGWLDGRVVAWPRRQRMSRTMPAVNVSRRLGGRHPSALSVAAICRDVRLVSRSSPMRCDNAG